MNTKIFMTSCAILFALIGINLILFPKEILNHLELGVSDTLEILMQTIGSLYYGLAMLIWMSRGNLIGGIYNRPVIVANLTHFGIAVLVLIKGIYTNPSLSYIIWIITIIYSIFTILFGILLIKYPDNKKNRTD
tara:strand:+ start:186 stop:587 length:402 start_codon:yes stop_codon:yes gene_type:complete